MITMHQLADQYVYSQRMVAGRKVIMFDYGVSLIGASNHYQLVIIEGLGHQYPNGKNHPVVMTQPLWEMFKAQRLP